MPNNHMYSSDSKTLDSGLRRNDGVEDYSPFCRGISDDIEIIVDGEIIFFGWNDGDVIQPMAEELGEPEFPEPRPCG
ncbi:MAG: hypothetical protein JW944_06240 [Deltaproteobacteria bacterium]|nr:hypothetical protein [Deltaproteobacteria bacterium]